MDGGILLKELLESMRAFALYLDVNTPTRGKLPRDNFREGFRWRLMPSPVNPGAAAPVWTF